MVEVTRGNDFLQVFHDAAKALGFILLYKGTVASIPAGYHICDGNAGTIDLRNKFVVAADADSGGVAKTTLLGAPAQTGGDVQHYHNLDSLVTSLDVGTDIPDIGGMGNYSNNASLSYGATTNTTIVPPFYALCFIQAI
jgi:hypothetical protein